MTRRLPLLWLFLGAVSCGDGPSQPRVPGSNGIGPAGGVIEAQNGLAELAIPENALSQTVSLSLVTSSSTVLDPALVAETVYALQPQATTFGLPATLTIDYDPAFLNGGGEGSLVIHRLESQGWTTNGVIHLGVDATENRVRARITQGGVYAILR